MSSCINIWYVLDFNFLPNTSLFFLISYDVFNRVAHVHERVSRCKECALIKLLGLLLTTMASQNGIYSALVQAEKGTFWALTLSHKMCPRKQTTEPKLLIVVSFFSGEVTSYTDTSYCIHILWEVCRSVFSGPPCIIIFSLICTIVFALKFHWLLFVLYSMYFTHKSMGDSLIVAYAPWSDISIKTKC